MRTIADICDRYSATHFHDNGEGLVGVYDVMNLRYVWFRFDPAKGEYVQTGTTLSHEGAARHRA